MATLWSHIVVMVVYAILAAPSSHSRLQQRRKHVALFVFGDSLFDAGNNNYINTTTNAQANFWPYGISFFDHPTGRFSDGRLIPDFISEYAQLPLIRPFLEPRNNTFYEGANFASAGAGALDGTNKRLNVISLRAQLEYFKSVGKRLIEKLGPTEANVVISKAVYIISIGSNDYGTLFQENSTALPSHSHELYVGMVIGNITAVIKEIYNLGGRKFGLLGLGPVGCTPGLRAISGNSGACIEELNSLASLHNKALSEALQQLDNCRKEFKYSIFNIYNYVVEIMNYPSKYGFREGKAACCGSGPYRGFSSCGGRRGTKKYELCENPNEYVFFDSGHPSAKANKELAKLFWGAPPTVTKPYNLKALFRL